MQEGQEPGAKVPALVSRVDLVDDEVWLGVQRFPSRIQTRQGVGEAISLCKESRLELLQDLGILSD
jgi:hypothetical protein